MGKCSDWETVVQGSALLAVFLAVKWYIKKPEQSSVYNYRRHIAFVSVMMSILAACASRCYSKGAVSFTIACAIGFLTSDAAYIGDPIPPSSTEYTHKKAISAALFLSACACVLVDILSTQLANWTPPVAIAFGSFLNMVSMHVLAGARYHSGNAYGFQYLRFQAWETLAISYVVSARANQENGLAVAILLPIMYIISGMVVWYWYFKRKNKALVGKIRNTYHRWASGVSSGVTIYFIIGGMLNENGTEVPEKPTWALLGLPIAAAGAAAFQVLTEDLPVPASESLAPTMLPEMKFKAHMPPPHIQF